MITMSLTPMQLLSTLHPLQLVPKAPEAPAAEDADEVLGCGWYDSSFDLRHGLDVTELALPEALRAGKWSLPGAVSLRSRCGAAVGDNLGVVEFALI